MRDAMLVLEKAYFYVSKGPAAEPFDMSRPAPDSWANLGHTGREAPFELMRVSPSDAELAQYELYPSVCSEPKYWKFTIPLLDFNRASWELAFPGGRYDSQLGGYAVHDGAPSSRSVQVVVHDKGNLSGIYFRRAGLLTESGINLAVGAPTQIMLSGLVLPPDESRYGKFLFLEGAEGT